MTEEAKRPLVVPPPPPRRGLSAVPMPVTNDLAPATNMSKPNSGTMDLNFKVDPETHHRFKMSATMRRMSMKDLLLASFNTWLEVHGQDLKDKF